MFLKANKALPIFIILVSLSILIGLDFIISSKKIETDNIAVNEIVQIVEINKDNLSGITYNGKYNFVVVDSKGNILYGKNPEAKSLDERKNDAIRNNQLILNFDNGDEDGYIFIDTNINVKYMQTLKFVKTEVYIFLLTFMVFMILYYIYIYLNLIRPFTKLQGFAANIAAGSLDSPLYRTKSNYFGLFTDSFDIMREELKNAKDKAEKLEKSKKELVAQLSHDIKTPIASIKAVLEIMQLTSKNDKDKNNLELISAKANDIDRLISDLFMSTLEELSELKINCMDIESGVILDIIKKADTEKRVKLKNSLPECLINVDELRLGQVFDNVISNSYKYAKTGIEISFSLDETFNVSIKDFGKGVEEDELALLTNKFFRGNNSKNINGAGLGLNIAANFMQKMGGGLEFVNLKDGFVVKIIISLS